MTKQNEMGWPKANMKTSFCVTNSDGMKTLKEATKVKNKAEAWGEGEDLVTGPGSIRHVKSHGK